MAKLDEPDRQTALQLQRYGLSPAVAQDLVLLGVTSAGQFGHEDPVALHRRLVQLGHPHAGLIEALAAGIHAARTGHAEVWM